MKQLINYVTPMLVVGLHYFTGWSWLEYLLVTVFIIMGTILGVVCYLRSKELESIGLTNTQVGVMTLNCILYAVYFNNIVLTGLIIISIALTFYVKKLCTKK